MARAFNPRYSVARLQQAAQAAVAQLQQTSQLADALQRGILAYEKQMTAVLLFAGASAMQPTLAPKGDTAERLLVRLIPRATPNKTVFEGDVVAFTRCASGGGRRAGRGGGVPARVPSPLPAAHTPGRGLYY